MRRVGWGKEEYPSEEGTRESRSLATNTDQQQNTVVTATTWSLDIPCWLLDIATAVLCD